MKRAPARKDDHAPSTRPRHPTRGACPTTIATVLDRRRSPRTRVVSALALVVGGLSSPPPTASCREDRTPTAPRSENRDCGAYATGVALALLGTSVPPLDELRRSTRTDADGTCSLADVARALEHRGCRTRVVEASESIGSGVFVAMLRRGDASAATDHFVVFEAVHEGLLLRYSSPVSVRRTTWERERASVQFPMLRVALRRRTVWGLLLPLGVLAFVLGGAWLLSRRRRGPAVAATLLVLVGCGPQGTTTSALGLRMEPGPYLDLGDRPQGEHLVTFELVNDTAAEVIVERIAASCACASVDLATAPPLRPGESRPGRLTLRVGGPGEAAATVSVEARGLPASTFTVRARGLPVTGFTYPDVVDGGCLAIGERREITVEVDVHPGASGGEHSLAPSWVPIVPLHLVSHVRSQVTVDSRTGSTRIRGVLLLRGDRVGPARVPMLIRLGETSLPQEIRWSTESRLGLSSDVFWIRPTSAVAHAEGRLRLAPDPGWTILGVGSDAASADVRLEDGHWLRVSLDRTAAPSIGGRLWISMSDGGGTRTEWLSIVEDLP